MKLGGGEDNRERGGETLKVEGGPFFFSYGQRIIRSFEGIHTSGPEPVMVTLDCKLASFHV